MNFVKIIFSGEHRIQEGDFGFLGPIHEPYTNQMQTISINISHFFKYTPDTRTIHETQTKLENRNFLQNNLQKRKYELCENNFLRRT